MSKAFTNKINMAVYIIIIIILLISANSTAQGPIKNGAQVIITEIKF
jgi:hypothetical protein